MNEKFKISIMVICIQPVIEVLNIFVLHEFLATVASESKPLGICIVEIG
jgi:hypothetical protein